MARSKQDPLERKVQRDLSRRRGAATAALSAPEVAGYTGNIKRLLDEGTKFVDRKLPGDKTKRTYRKVNAGDNIWDFLIPLHQGNLLPKQIVGAGAFGAVFEGRIAYNPYNCREFYAQEEAHEFMKTENLQEKLEEITDEKKEEITGDDWDTVFNAVCGEAMEEAEAMNDKEIVELMKTRFKKIAPRGKICVKLAWLPADYMRLYRRERRVVGLDHKNIAYVFAVDEVPRTGADEDEARIIMTAQEFIDPTQTPGEFDQTGIDQRFEYIVQAGDGLRELHRIGLMHRDFKKSNVMITKDGVVKIIDKGLAKLIDRKESSVTGMGDAIGTPAYCPPEQAIGDEVDLRADIYAVGATLYEYLVGETPNTLVTTDPYGIAAMLAGNSLLPLMPSQTQGINEMVQRYAKEKRLSEEEAAGFLQDIDLVFTKILHRDRNKRYQEVREFQEDLKALKDGKKPPCVYAELKSKGIEPEQYVIESFAYHLGRHLKNKSLYHNAQESQRRQRALETRVLSQSRPAEEVVLHRSIPEAPEEYTPETPVEESPETAVPEIKQKKSGPLKRYVLRPLLWTGTAVLTAAVAGGATVAITYPDLAKQALDYIMGK